MVEIYPNDDVTIMVTTCMAATTTTAAISLLTEVFGAMNEEGSISNE